MSVPIVAGAFPKGALFRVGVEPRFVGVEIDSRDKTRVRIGVERGVANFIHIRPIDIAVRGRPESRFCDEGDKVDAGVGGEFRLACEDVFSTDSELNVGRRVRSVEVNGDSSRRIGARVFVPYRVISRSGFILDHIVALADK